MHLFLIHIVFSCVHSEFYNNYYGLLAYQYNEDDVKVMIEDVTPKNNQEYGIYLTGTGITVNNANIKNSGGIGLAIGSNVVNEITLAGDITSTNNDYGFITFSSTKGSTVHVTGNLDLNLNGEYGVATDSADFTVAVGGSYSGKSGKSGSGSLTACGNGLYDINNAGGSTFVGSDYTCDTTDGPVPDCKPCYPGCSSPEPDESTQTMVQETMTMDSSMTGTHHKADEPIPTY